MKEYMIVILLVGCTCASPQVKTVKTGQGNFPYNANANLARFYENNGTGYNNVQGYHTNTQNEFASGQSEYHQGQSGYTNSQSGYNQGQAGYSNAQNGYNQGQAGYSNAQNGYNQGQAGYNGAQSGYNQGQAGYNSAQGGYNQGQAGYNGAQGGFTQGQSGYNGGQNEFTYTQGGQNGFPGGFNQVLGRQNLTQDGRNLTGLNPTPDYERGVCYIEVPTAELVRDRTQVPLGNGSRPDLSRVRSCCKGYIRNIHNFRLCDPVCTEECVNGLCTAPDTCTCFPDHVKNAGGFCIPTCPIGCQHGTCSGGECLCKDGYSLDTESKFCLPRCNRNCGKQGNCTAPDTCECRKGYRATSSGGCEPHCDSCQNGDCVGPNVCVCNHGYRLESGNCVPECIQGCGNNGRCVAPNRCECQNPDDQEFDTATRQCRDKPKCTRKCTNGECYGANACRCNSGYTNNQVGDCMPVCSPGCGLHGECTGPNKCRCQPGYSSQHGEECKPDSNQGQYGQFEQGQLVEQLTDCSQPCINGVCSGGICICNPGYDIDTTDPSGNRCIPSCPGGCPNGTCSAPNFCICNAGYVKDRSIKGSQKCVRRNKRSIEQPNIADLITYNIPDY